MKKSSDLKSLIMSPLAGFRHIETTVPEWGDTTFILREPSGEAWAQFNDLATQIHSSGITDEEAPPGEEKDKPELTSKLSAEEADKLAKLADAQMLVDVLLDSKGIPVFSNGDAELLAPHIGPVHSRVIRRAIDLAVSFDDAEKK